MEEVEEVEGGDKCGPVWEKQESEWCTYNR